jgi:hypothetical protein
MIHFCLYFDRPYFAALLQTSGLKTKVTDLEDESINSSPTVAAFM